MCTVVMPNLQGKHGSGPDLMPKHARTVSVKSMAPPSPRQEKVKVTMGFSRIQQPGMNWHDL